jgi:hypothetical protein
MTQMRRFSQIQDEVKAKFIFEINDSEKEIEKLANAVAEARMVFDAKVEELKVAKFNLDRLKKTSNHGVHEVFEKELKAKYLPEATDKMAEMVYLQASEHTSTMDELASKYEDLVIFYNSLKVEDSSK